jgi:DNA primase small subunit
MPREDFASSSQRFIFEKFSEYYNNPSTDLKAPFSIGQREFAFLLFKDKIMTRHKSFGTVDRLRSYINAVHPSDVYNSCAYYENPETEMDKKGWLGADLVFDIDADHIPTTCSKIHDEWICKNCNFEGRGITPESCPVCESQKFDTKTWPCEICLNSAKQETRKVIDMLKIDFGLADEAIHVFFSGHRGYHIQVESNNVRMLNAMARKEIVDYVSGLGLNIFENDHREGRSSIKKKHTTFSLPPYGWGARLREGIRRFILQVSKDDLRGIGIKVSPDLILQNKEVIIKRCLEENKWASIRGVSVETWSKITEHVRNLESAKIDTVVTTDIHRLIRSNGSLHGKTGLKKLEFPPSHLKSFDPFMEAVAFKEGKVKLLVESAPRFKICNEEFGPYHDEKVDLPTSAAVLLICKGRGEVLKENV